MPSKGNEYFELNDKGYIKLPRSIRTEPIWKEKPFSKGQALAELLFEATFEDRREIKFCGKKIILIYGQAFILKKSFSKYCGWNRPKLDRFLKKLEKHSGERFAITQEIVRKSSHDPKGRPAAIGTIITFINFDRIFPKREK